MINYTDLLYQEPYYHEDQTSPLQKFYMNRYNRKHLYVQTNTANNAIYQAGDYQTLNVPPKQWVYWPYPETFAIKQLLPTYPITVASFATDEVISQLGRYGETYQDYVRAEQAFSASITGTPAANHFLGLQIVTPANSQSNIIVDQIRVDCAKVPNQVILSQLTVADPNLTLSAVISNQRLDGNIHNIVPIAFVNYSLDTTTTPGIFDMVIEPYTGQIDVLGNQIREIPKLYQGALAVYVQEPGAGTGPMTINIAWHEEL